MQELPCGTGADTTQNRAELTAEPTELPGIQFPPSICTGLQLQLLMSLNGTLTWMDAAVQTQPPEAWVIQL